MTQESNREQWQGNQMGPELEGVRPRGPAARWKVWGTEKKPLCVGTEDEVIKFLNDIGYDKREERGLYAEDPDGEEWVLADTGKWISAD